MYNQFYNSTLYSIISTTTSSNSRFEANNSPILIYPYKRCQAFSPKTGAHIHTRKTLPTSTTPKNAFTFFTGASESRTSQDNATTSPLTWRSFSLESKPLLQVTLAHKCDISFQKLVPVIYLL